MKHLHPRVKLRGSLERKSVFHIWKTHLLDLKGIYFFGILSVLMTTLAEVGIPKLSQHAIDGLSAHPTKDFFLKIAAILTLLLLIQYLGRILWRVLLAQQAHHTSAKFKSLIWDRARYLPQSRLDRGLRPGDLMNIATGDVNTARFALSFNLVMTSDMIFLFILTLTLMFSISPKLTLWTLIILPALPYFLHKLMLREGIQHDLAQASLSKLSDLSAQSVSTIRLQRLTQTAEFWASKLFKASENYLGQRKNVIQTSLLFIPITGVTPIISYGVLLILGLKEVQNGHLSMGSFVAMQSYIFIIQTPLVELGEMISEWQRAFTSFSRVHAVYAEPEEENLRENIEISGPTHSGPEIYSVQNYSYAYALSQQKALKPISFSLKARDRLGVMGPVGSGKSTLLLALAGQLSKTSGGHVDGEISFKGKPLLHHAHQDLTRRISLVHQKPFLFADTVQKNLCLQDEYTYSEIKWALDCAGVLEDVESLPQGLHTRIGEWGVNLSGGQKQRLTLARSLLRKPEILLLDDCLSAVDTVTEERILSKLNSELQDTIIVWVAHRESTLRYCNSVLKLGEEA